MCRRNSEGSLSKLNFRPASSGMKSPVIFLWANAHKLVTEEQIRVREAENFFCNREKLWNVPHL